MLVCPYHMVQHLGSTGLQPVGNLGAKHAADNETRDSSAFCFP